MTTADFSELISPYGQAALAFAQSLKISEANRLSSLQTLRKTYPAPLANAVLETILLRAKAKSKFRDAERMYFTREALEQSTGETVASYRVKRFAGYEHILDLGCGIGGDLIAFARAGHTVIGFEKDELRAKIATANLAACSLAGHVRVEDALTAILPDVDAGFCDPARRMEGHRILSPEESTPAPSYVIDRFPRDFPLAFKLAPGINVQDAEAYGGEIEFISLDGELKECVVWLGPLKTADRRATVLRTNGAVHTLTGDGLQFAPIDAAGEFLYDPDPAVVRPGLAGTLAESLGLHALDARVATLTGPKVDSPFVQRFAILAECDLDVKKVLVELRTHDVGPVTIIKRGVIIETDPLTKKWSGSGKQNLTIFLTPVEDRPRAFICRREG